MTNWNIVSPLTPSFAPAQVLNLPTGAKLGEAGSITAIWDGAQFVLEVSSGRVIRQYGHRPDTFGSTPGSR